MTTHRSGDVRICSAAYRNKSGAGFAAFDLCGRKNVGREQIVEPGALKSVTNFLGRAARRHAFGPADRGDRLANMGNGWQIIRIVLQRRLLHLGFKVVRKTAPEFGFYDQSCFAIRYAEETIENLIGRDRIAMAGQHR